MGVNLYNTPMTRFDMRGRVAVLMVSCVAALALLMRGFMRTHRRVLVPVVPLVERPPAVVDRFSSLSHGNVSRELLPQVWARHRLDNASYFESHPTQPNPTTGP